MSLTAKTPSMSKITGELCESYGAAIFLWTIPNFSSLSDKTGDYYSSPVFCFSGASFYIAIYPNGDSHDSSTGFVGLYLCRSDTGGKMSVAFTLEILFNNINDPKKFADKSVFHGKGIGRGSAKIMLATTLKQSQFRINDELTILCSMKHEDSQHLRTSLFTRMYNVTVNLKDIFLQKKRTDLVLNVKGKEISAHKMILETRCPVLSLMFSHDMKENRTGKVNIKDIDQVTIGNVLYYLYTGEIPNGLSIENVLIIYSAAHIYDVTELKQLCVEFVKQNLSVEWVCEVLPFAIKYQEEGTAEAAWEFFKSNTSEIIKTDSWKEFKKQDFKTAMDILEATYET